MFTHFGIFITYRCNLSCDYCYVDKTSQKTLTFRSFKKAINLFFSQSKNIDRSIIFEGGEPLMEWHKLKKFIKYIHSHPLFEQKRSLLLVFTNGLLLDSNKLDFFKKFGVSVALSFDGTRKTQDLNRKTITPRANGSFKKILQNISLFSEAQKNDITINSVTTPKTCLGLTKNLRFIRKLGFKKIDFYPTYQWWETDQLKKLSLALQQFGDHYVGTFNANKKEQVFMIPSLHSILAKKQWGDDKLTKCSELRLSPEGSFFSC